MPFLLNTPGNAQAVREAYEATSALRSTGVTGFVLLEIDVREDGRVGSAKAILPPQTNTMFTTHGIDEVTGEPMGSLPPHTLHPGLCEAAERSALKCEFAPATQDGIPVPYQGYRHGFNFDAAVSVDAKPSQGMRIG
jgi:hypothetical protein